MSIESAAKSTPAIGPVDHFLKPAALSAIVIRSATAPIGKYALQDFQTLAYSSLRPVIGATLHFVYQFVHKQSIRLPSADLKRIGVFGVALSQLCYIGGALSTTIVAHAMMPGERFTPIRAIGGAPAPAGVGLVRRG